MAFEITAEHAIPLIQFWRARNRQVSASEIIAPNSTVEDSTGLQSKCHPYCSCYLPLLTRWCALLPSVCNLLLVVKLSRHTCFRHHSSRTLSQPSIPTSPVKYSRGFPRSCSYFVKIFYAVGRICAVGVSVSTPVAAPRPRSVCGMHTTNPEAEHFTKRIRLGNETHSGPHGMPSVVIMSGCR
jgi:hypothetical protein